MSFVPLLALAFISVALCWALLVLRRTRDWRVGFFVVMLALLAVHETLEFLGSRSRPPPMRPTLFTETMGLLVSVMALLAVVFLDRLLAEDARVRRDLEASRANYRDLYDQAPDMYVSVDAATARIRECNLTLIRKLGYPREKIIGRKIFELYHPDCMDSVHEAFQSFVTTGEVKEAELELMRSDGSKLEVSLNVSAVRDTDGKVLYSRSAWRDISEQKQARRELRVAEARFKQLFHAGPVSMIVSTAEDGRIVEANENFLLMSGYSAEELRGRTALDLDMWVNPEERAELVRMVRKHGRVRNMEMAFRSRSGDIRIGRVAVELLDIGRIPHLLTIAEDVTEARRDERALRLTQLSVDQSPQAVYWVRMDGSFSYVNDAACRMLGYTRGELLTMSVPDIDPEFDRESWPARRDAIRARGAFVAELRHRSKSGALIPVEISANYVEAAGEGYFCAHCVDISERKRNDLRQRGRGQVLEALARGAPLNDVLDVLVQSAETVAPQWRCSVLLLDENAKCLRDGAACSLPQFYRQAIDGIKIAPDAGSCGAAAYRNERVIVSDVKTHPNWVSFQDLALRADIRACWSEPIRSSEGRVLGTFAMYAREPREPTAADLKFMQVKAQLAGIAIERRRTEEALARSEQRFRSYFELPLIGIAISSPSGDWTECNDRLTEILGRPREEIVSHAWADLTHPDDLAANVACFKRVLAGKSEGYSLKKRFVRPDGSHVHTRVSARCVRQCDGAVDYLVVLVDDISERIHAEQTARKAREELFDQQRREKEHVAAELARTREELVSKTRLATLGQLAATIAHELRNPLGAVRNAAYLLKNAGPDGDGDWAHHLKLIETEVNNSNRIISDLLEMSRGKEPHRRRVEFDAALRRAWEQANVPDTVQRRARLEPATLTVFADPGQLEQVLRNLLINANQAIDGKGVIQIDAHRHNGFDEFIVADSGPGIAREARPHIFEALYSTKAKGTGLGLPICTQLVERHGGSIDLCDSDLPGAAFRVRLPATIET